MQISDWIERREQCAPRQDDYRTPYEIDLARILHSTSFRRLQDKTQIISQSDGDFHRTRLTHSLEVAQISQGIAQRLRAHKELPDVLRTYGEDQALLQAISLVHDLGHPPGGHANEEILHQFARGRGFEGNAQTLRILARLEQYSEGAGANLTRRTLLGILKYPVSFSSCEPKRTSALFIGMSGVPMLRGDDAAPPKCYHDEEEDVVAWLLRPLTDADRHKVRENRMKSVDCGVMDLADDLAYSIGDLEDAIAIGLITREQFETDLPKWLWHEYMANRGFAYDLVVKNLFSSSRLRKQEIGAILGYGISRTSFHEREMNSDLYRYEFRLNNEASDLIDAIKCCILERVIKSPQIQHGRYQMQLMMMRVLDLLLNDPRSHLPAKQYQRYQEAGNDERVILDWMSGATEGFLRKLYARLFVPAAASVTDRL